MITEVPARVASASEQHKRWCVGWTAWTLAVAIFQRQMDMAIPTSSIGGEIFVGYVNPNESECPFPKG